MTLARWPNKTSFVNNSHSTTRVWQLSMGKKKTKRVFVGDVGYSNIHQRIPEESCPPMCSINRYRLDCEPLSGPGTISSPFQTRPNWHIKPNTDSKYFVEVKESSGEVPAWRWRKEISNIQVWTPWKGSEKQHAFTHIASLLRLHNLVPWEILLTCETSHGGKWVP